MSLSRSLSQVSLIFLFELFLPFFVDEIKMSVKTQEQLNVTSFCGQIVMDRDRQETTTRARSNEMENLKTQILVVVTFYMKNLKTRSFISRQLQKFKKNIKLK